MKKGKLTFGSITLVIGILLLISGTAAMAGTVVMDDSKNHEDLALKVDRLLVDACNSLMDCKKGTKQANANALLSSKRAQTNGMVPSTFTGNNLSAYYAGSVQSANSAQTADTAVWANGADNTYAGVTAFSATNLTSTALVESAVRTNAAGHVTYAKSAVNNGSCPQNMAWYGIAGCFDAVYAYWFPASGGSITTKASERLYPSRPVGFSLPLESMFVRNASSFYNGNATLEWAQTTGAYDPANAPGRMVSGQFSDSGSAY